MQAATPTHRPGQPGAEGGRWELYRLLGEPLRLRLLTLTSAEELTVGELAEILGESQPNVSRHLKALRAAGLVTVRRQGARALARLKDSVGNDPVVHDALEAGTRLCVEDGSLDRVPQLVRARDVATRAHFDQPTDEGTLFALPDELPAYLTALAQLIHPRALAIDAGTGDGRLLELLAPIFDSVLAVDRAAPRLAQAERRMALRAYSNVELVEGELDGADLRARAQALGGADVVFASRVLHHAPKPAGMLRALGALARPGGAVVILDYVSHQDERLRDQQADLWLGFSSAELVSLAEKTGLVGATVHTIPSPRCGQGPDGHLDWQVLVARTQE